MAACRRLTCFVQKKHFYLCRSSAFYSTNPSAKEITGQKEIVVPYRIERGPTDILKALSSTISKDPTAAHYKYEDDPYFMPASNITKRSFALSKESGRKAARYFLEKFPELFKCNQSVPHIKAFDPPITYTETDDVTENILKVCIASNDVNNCIDVFNILKKKGISVSQETKQDLLDLLCFYNSFPPPPDDYYEERFFQRNDGTTNQKWNAKGMAEQLFEDMEKDGRAYSAMISGLSRYGDPERALLLHNEMKSKDLIGTVQAYNCLISECHLINENSSIYWEQANHLLHQMNVDGLKPDVYTMNALLRILSKATKWRKSKQLSLSIMAEMKRLNIEPSLGSYYYLVMIFASADASSAGILYEIMNHIEDKELEIQHPADVLFFATAMECCWKSLHDKDLAYRIHSLLEYKKNCKLLGNSLSESHYFKCFFRLLSENEDVEIFMELYDKFVPNTYTPEPIVMLSIIQAIHFAGAYKHLPRLCSDILLFEQTERINILEALLDAAACTKHEDEIQKPLIEMIWNIMEKLNNRAQGRRMQFDWSGALLGNFLKTFINGKDLEKSWSVMKKLSGEEHLILGFPEKHHLLEFCQFCVDVQDYEKMVFCVKYATNGIYPEFREDLINLVDELIEEQKLDGSQRDIITARVGALNIDEESSNKDSIIDSSSSESSSGDSSSESSSGDSSSESSSDDESTKPKSQS